jgi:putative ABC transport system permease protein
MDRLRWLGNVSQDLRYGARQLRLNPGFTAVAVLSLALGVGANTAIFQLVDAVRLRTLPVANSQELAMIDLPRGSMRSGWFSTRSARLTYAQWEEIRTRQQAFTGTLAWSATRFNLAAGGEARYAEGLYVSGDFFRVLGVPPILGRSFTADDDRPACGSPGAIVSYAFWQRELGGDPGAIGQTVRLEGKSFPIIGITPMSFFGVEVGNRYDVALPMCADRMFPGNDGRSRAEIRTAWWLSAMGRLKPGWTAGRATAHLQALSPGIMEASLPPTYRPDDAKRYLANKLAATEGATGVSQLRRDYESPLWLLLATTGLVLLIACANLANLLLARASIREREMALRQAIGASRARLIVQLLSESLLLALAGAALGALLAQFLSRGLVAFLSTPGSPLFVGLGLDVRVLGFTAAIAVGTCLLFGLLPAVRGTSVSPASVMRAGGRGLTAGRERFSLRRALVTAQVALSLVLLVGALLFVRSLQKLLAVDPGFRAEGIVEVNLDLRRPQYQKERLLPLYRTLLERLAAQPGVVSAAQVGFTPVSGAGWNNMVRPDTASGIRKESNFNSIGPGYFRTMGTALIAGRDFDDRDTAGAPKVAIVNEVFAKTVFGGGNPVGHTFRVEGQAGKPDPIYQVVGVVRNTKYYELREDFLPIGFLPSGQDDNPGADATFVLRTAAPLGDVFRGSKAAMAAVHPEIVIQFRVLTTQLQESMLRERLMATLAGSFGFLAGVLATLGLYGVIAYMVARRRNEIGVRIALGADRGSVIRLVLREAALMLIFGLVIGTGLALWAGRAAAALLFGMKPYDPLTFAGAIVLLAAVALMASYGPARRASRLEPMQALREE